MTCDDQRDDDDERDERENERVLDESLAALFARM